MIYSLDGKRKEWFNMDFQFMKLLTLPFEVKLTQTLGYGLKKGTFLCRNQKLE